MKKIILFMILLTFLFLRVTFASITIDEVKRAIAEKGATWTAAENWVTRLSEDERRQLCGAILKPMDGTQAELLSLPPINSLPAKFDWRDHQGNWVTPVKDQGQCGSCWDFSAVGQIESWWMIHNANPDSMIDLSEQFILSCSNAGTCADGGWMHEALEFVKFNGVPPEACFDYRAVDGIPCSEACADWKDHTVTIPGWGWITYGKIIVDNIKSAVYRNPVSAAFTVYSDFYSYHSGVYEHVFGEVEGGHAIVIVGWDDEEQSWICKNSWGKDWGQNGYFRIKWGDSEMGDFVPFIWDKMTSRRSVEPSPERFDFSLIVGDTAVSQLQVKNKGQEPLEFAVMDYGYPGNISQWIDIRHGSNKLSPNEICSADIKVITRYLTPGFYECTIGIRSNDSYTPLVELPCTLQLRAPDHDVAVSEVILPGETLSIFSYLRVQANIENVGLSPEGNFKASCEIAANGQVLYRDTVRVETIAPAKSRTIQFNPMQIMQTGELNFKVKIIDLNSDYNDFNDESRTTRKVTNVVDNFENQTGYWLCEGGWGIGDKLNGHSGSNSAHVNNGIFPYPDNMNALMTFVPGFDLHAVQSAVLRFYTRYVTEQDKDIYFVEVSGDQVNWVVMDSFSGMNPAWVQREINLTDFIKPEFPKVWVRFRFVSDETNNSIGVLIDDVSVYPAEITKIITEQMNHGIPEGWILAQNFPNPFNPRTTIRYRLPDGSEVSIRIYDLLGNLIISLTDHYQAAGDHQVQWDGKDARGMSVSSGLYLYSLRAGNLTLTRKMMLMK